MSAECCLRPMNENDLSLVLSWRNSERIRQSMLTKHEISVDEHRAWWQRTQSNGGTIPMIFEVMGRPIGFINITNLNYCDSTCSWSIYIGDETAPAGSGSVMGKMAIRYIFQTLKLQTIQVEVLQNNSHSLRFHTKLGFKVLEDNLTNGLIHMRLGKDDWDDAHLLNEGNQ